MPNTHLSGRTKTTLLLCCALDEHVEPLRTREFNEVRRVLRRLSIPLRDLLTEDGQQRLRADLEGRVLFDNRLRALLSRGDALSAAVERWGESGFWILDRDHHDYPARYHRLLGESAPPLLFGTGDNSMLNDDAPRLAVVGSREIEPETSGAARRLGQRAAENGVTVVSGGARGVDRTTVDGALERNGTAIVVLPGDLARAAHVRQFRASVQEGRMLLVSPYPPEEAFSGENALGRNRLIYCLADVAIVVSANERRGGTWSGATEALRRGWVPLYVRQPAEMPDGTRGLLEHGASPLPHDIVDDPDRLAAWLESSIPQAGSPDPDETGNRQLGLFGDE